PANRRDVDAEILHLVLVVDGEEGQERLGDGPPRRPRERVAHGQGGGPRSYSQDRWRERERRVPLLDVRVDVHLGPEGAAHLGPLSLGLADHELARLRVGVLAEGDRYAIVHADRARARRGLGAGRSREQTHRDRRSPSESRRGDAPHLALGTHVLPSTRASLVARVTL